MSVVESWAVNCAADGGWMDERIDITCIVDTCRDSEKDGTRDFGERKKGL